MAIVINTNPTTNASANNEMLFVAYEATKANDEVTYPDYRYVCDVYVSAVLVGRLKARPDPTHKRGVFDVSAILRSYITSALKATYGNSVEIYSIKTSYTCKFGEEYSDTLYTNLTVDSERECYATYDVKPFDDTDVLGDVNGDFATSMPATIYSDKTVKWQILPFWSNVSGITNFSYLFYDNTGTQIGSTGTLSVSGYVAKKIFQMNVGFVKLAALASLSTAQNTAVEYYEVTGNSKAKRIYLSCSKYPVYTLAWLNKYGAYESYSFTLVSKKQTEITKKEFQQLNYKWDSSGVVSYGVDGVYYGGKRGFATDMKTMLKLTSHLLNDNEYSWLAQLFHSPDVYLYNSDRSLFMPVSIQENNYEVRTYLNSRLKPLEFSVVFSDNYNAQYL